MCIVYIYLAKNVLKICLSFFLINTVYARISEIRIFLICQHCLSCWYLPCFACDLLYILLCRSITWFGDPTPFASKIIIAAITRFEIWVLGSRCHDLMSLNWASECFSFSFASSVPLLLACNSSYACFRDEDFDFRNSRVDTSRPFWSHESIPAIANAEVGDNSKLISWPFHDLIPYCKSVRASIHLQTMPADCRRWLLRLFSSSHESIVWSVRLLMY